MTAKGVPNSRSGRCGTLVLVILLAAAIVVVPLAGTARPDTASKTLAPYQKPTDQALERALVYLARTQHPNGCWSPNPNDLSPRNGAAITSLCAMAFLAKGHTPGVGPYGEVLNRAIDFVMDSQKPNGILAKGPDANGPMYSHCISTLMLSEVSGMVDPIRQKKLDSVLSIAIKVILAAQQLQKDNRNAGGWRYQINSRDSDISCTGWALMALRSVRNNGATVPKEAIDRGIEYVLKNESGDGGFTYQPNGGPGWGRTGTAVLALELCGQHGSRPALMGGDWILRHLPPRYGAGEYFAYANYYCAQATFQLGDKYWEQYAARMYEILLKAQNEDGSWPSAGGGEGDGGGNFYPTAMAVLALSVPYRQLPIYQR
jgi:prenyltransferase beta subunit